MLENPYIAILLGSNTALHPWNSEAFYKESISSTAFSKLEQRKKKNGMCEGYAAGNAPGEQEAETVRKTVNLIWPNSKNTEHESGGGGGEYKI